MANAFNDTKNLFINYTNYSEPLSYSQWLAVPEDRKAAILYVQFYEQITLAWYKTKSFFVLEEDGVETILQYLVKNVPILKENPKRFTPSYIYKVAYNCLYCISHDIQRDIQRWENETSNIVGFGEDELDLFATVEVHDPDTCEELTKAKFWAIIEQMGPETEKVVNHLLNGTSLGCHVVTSKDPSTLASWNKKTEKERESSMFTYQCMKKNQEIDPLKDISVSVEEMEHIIEDLKVKLASFKDIYYGM